MVTVMTKHVMIREMLNTLVRNTLFDCGHRLIGDTVSNNIGHLVDNSYIFWELEDQVRNELRGER